MFELSVKKAFNRHEKQMDPLSENEEGALVGGFSNFPKSKSSLGEPVLNIHSTIPHLKASRFNSFIPYESKMLGFNAFTQRFLVMEAELLDLLNAAIMEDDLQGLSEIHPEFYQELRTHGFILEKDVDETQKVKDLREEVDFAENRYMLIINPTMNCNFKCWYCYESHIKGSKMQQDTLEKINKHIDHVIATKKEVKQFAISWFGGEPMLYYDQVVKPIVEYAHKRCEENGIEFSSAFTSNGYLVKEKMIPFFQQHNITHFQITLDGAKEKHDTVRFVANKKGTFDDIIKSIRLLGSNKISVTVRINYTDETLNKIEEVLGEFSDLPESTKKYLTFSFHNVWQEGKPNQEKLEKIITNFRRNDFATSSLYSNFNSLRASCYADKKNHATINYDGEVFKCTARDFKNDEKEGTIGENGNIIWNERFEKRMDSKFKNSPCLSCRIQPLCNGGCSQQALEHDGLEYCVVEGSGVEKDDIILGKFKQILEHQIIRRSKLVRRINRGIF